MLMIFASFAEVISIGTVLPFLGVLVSPEYIFQNPSIHKFFSFFGLNEAQQLLLPLTVLFSLFALCSGVARIGLLRMQTRLGFGIGADFSAQIYENTLYQPYSVHTARNSSQIITGISTKTHTVINSTLLPLLFITSSAFILCATLIMLIYVEPIVTCATFVGFGLLYCLIAFATRKRLTSESLRISQESSQVIKALQEGLGGIRDILIDGTQPTYCQIYRNADLAMRRSQASIQIIGSTPRFIIETLGIVLIAILAYILTRSEAGVSNAIPMLGLLAVGAQRLLPALQQIYHNWTSIRGSRASLKDVLELLDQSISQNVRTLQKPLPFNNKIQLSNIGFRHSGNLSSTLENINLEIFKGSRVGFVGTTGSGKSTLLDIVMGLLQPTVGRLIVDGIEVTEYNQNGWRAHIAHVPQMIFLADGTIAENIAFGVPTNEIDYQRVECAAAQAQIAETVESMSSKYNTIVGERGIRLSGGQRQRIGIARALYKNADVIVFDEATSALDNETELAVMESISSLGREVTVITVAHRLSTLMNCDRVYELKNGKLSRAGSFSEMIFCEGGDGW